ncbi:DUF2637 domain-containing protein [Saccharopolyspora mangrovi]|uniref:DUF2637 domain-containing protein n=1 Tax=Saccharopolyspora mangrovi TaxID=3082379 RepID=A0ABU6AF84_9PSEU|nr:DUF2637 domain-containing protein [Saccharopolyspora sp. S2-29]MEB3370223.1 DUF2637 domain-containing protein [Saccharopolyspora sp. S2-29]
MNQDEPPQISRAHLWLSPVALGLVALAAVMGWAASFVGLHEYGMTSMTGFGYWTAWLVPATFDGAAFACTLMTYRASIHGRSALRARLLMWGFTAVSSWINWIHQPTLETRLVAAGLPVAAVAVFDIVLLEMRADYEARHGRTKFRLRPGLLVLRWLVDRTGTTTAFRTQITAIPVHQLIGQATPAELPAPESRPATPVAPAASPAPPTPPVADKPTTEIPKVVSRGPKLPPPMLKAVQAAYTRARNEGREFTADDVHAVIKVPADKAEQIAASYSTTNGHALA